MRWWSATNEAAEFYPDQLEQEEEKICRFVRRRVAHRLVTRHRSPEREVESSRHLPADL